jgi:hypothetical protein
VSRALLRGYRAELAGPQRYVEINGLPAVVMLAGMGAWQIADVEEFTASEQQRYILVDVTGGAARFYTVPGDELRAGIRRRHTKFFARAGGTRPLSPASKHAAVEPVHVQEWEDHWALFDAGEA